MEKISTVIITLNEAAHIADCVQQALKVSEEVIVIDAESSDNTAQLAKDSGATVHIRKWEGYGAAKNYGNELAKNDWILSLDGDEVITNGFIASLRDMDLKDEVVYEIDIQTFYYGKALRHSGFYPLWKKRLFNKRYFSWNAAAVHEGLEGKIMHSTKRIVGKVHHYSFKDKLQYEEKMDNYARLGALRWIDEGRKPGKMKYLFGPAFRFVKAYILNLGILDGRAGYEIALMDMRTNRKKLNYFRQLSTTHH